MSGACRLLEELTEVTEGVDFVSVAQAEILLKRQPGRLSAAPLSDDRSFVIRLQDATTNYLLGVGAVEVLSAQYVLAIDTYTRCLQRVGKEELARGSESDESHNNHNHHHNNEGSGGGGGGGGANTSGVGGSGGHDNNAGFHGSVAGGGGDDGNGHGPLIAECLYHLAQCHLALNNYAQAQVHHDSPPYPTPPHPTPPHPTNLSKTPLVLL